MKVLKTLFWVVIQNKIFAKETVGFPDDYTFAKESWGKVYYKFFDERNYIDAAKQCRRDGGTLPFPKSGRVICYNEQLNDDISAYSNFRDRCPKETFSEL